YPDLSFPSSLRLSCTSELETVGSGYHYGRVRCSHADIGKNTSRRSRTRCDPSLYSDRCEMTVSLDRGWPIFALFAKVGTRKFSHHSRLRTAVLDCRGATPLNRNYRSRHMPATRLLSLGQDQP